MTDKTATQVANMKKQTIGVEIEMNGISMTANVVYLRKFNPTPTANYYSILNEGYKDFGFDTKILRAVLLENFAPYESANSSR